MNNLHNNLRQTSLNSLWVCTPLFIAWLVAFYLSRVYDQVSIFNFLMYLFFVLYIIFSIYFEIIYIIKFKQFHRLLFIPAVFVCFFVFAFISILFGYIAEIYSPVISQITGYLSYSFYPLASFLSSLKSLQVKE